MRSRRQPGDGRHNRATPRKGKPTAKPPEGTETPGNNSSERGTSSKPGLSPDRLETIGKVLPGIIKAVAVLIDAIAKLPK